MYFHNETDFSQKTMDSQSSFVNLLVTKGELSLMAAETWHMNLAEGLIHVYPVGMQVTQQFLVT